MFREKAVMKIFIYVLIATAILGGFADGELSDDTFSIIGMVVGGVGNSPVVLVLKPEATI